MELTKEELYALGEHSMDTVPWKIIEKIPLKRFGEDEPPTILIEFGGTYIAKTVIDGESVWAVLSKHKGKFHYTAYADTLEALLVGL